MNYYHRAIFSDFDGTISREDVGYHIFTHFSKGRNADVINKWKKREVSTRECLQEEASLCDTSQESIIDLIDNFEIDRTFPAFFRKCKSNSLPLVIISEGMDFYIKYILNRYDLSSLPFISNQGLLEGDSIHIGFPHKNRKCKQCGNCKAERIEEYRHGIGDKCEIAFIGDGYSDTCAAGEADLIFAKNDLELYCREHKIEYTPFDNFEDVTRELLLKGWIKESV